MVEEGLLEVGHGSSTPVIVALGRLRHKQVDDCSSSDIELQAGLGHMAKAYFKEDKTNK